MTATRSPAPTPDAISPAEIAFTSSANVFEETGCHPPPTLRSKATLSGNSAALPKTASVRFASSGRVKLDGTEYSATRCSLFPAALPAVVVTNRSHQAAST
jgi:hypothetical protein